MFREILTRLAESASDTNEDMQVDTQCVTLCACAHSLLHFQSYVLEIVLTLECALDHLPEDTSLLGPGRLEVSRKISELSPLPS